MLGQMTACAHGSQETHAHKACKIKEVNDAYTESGLPCLDGVVGDQLTEQ